jgi:urease accessory protein
MRAIARVVAAADDDGVTRLTGLRSEPPLLLRHSPAATGPAIVYLLGGAAGPLGGDDLHLQIVVGERARLRIEGIAASIALPARSGAASRVTITATVARDGELHWLPEQLIAAQGCQHLAMSNVELADGARLLWREELICGRHKEPPGDVTISTSVTYAGKPLLRQALQVGPAAVHWDGPGILGGAKATGSLLGVNTAPPSGRRPVRSAKSAAEGSAGREAVRSAKSAAQGSAGREAVRSAKSAAQGDVAVRAEVLNETAVRVPLAGPGWLVTATAAGARELRSVLTPAPR